MSSRPIGGGRILTENDVVAFKWNPLEDRGPAPEYIPPRWDAPHCGKRLVEALRTLRLMPAVSGPQAFGGAWPAYVHDWGDLLAQQESDEQQKQHDRHEQNRVRLRPSSIEISHMEQAICWPLIYLKDRPQLVRCVMTVAVGRSRDRGGADYAAKRLQIPGRLVRRWNSEGLSLIAKGLIIDKVRIF